MTQSQPTVTHERAASVQQGKHPQKTQHQGKTQQPTAKPKTAQRESGPSGLTIILTFLVVIPLMAVYAYKRMKAKLGYRTVTVRHEY
jgi:hypothetical protein